MHAGHTEERNLSFVNLPEHYLGQYIKNNLKVKQQQQQLAT